MKTDPTSSELVLPDISTNLKTEADHDEVHMQDKLDSIDNLRDATTRQKYSKSYSEMPKDFRPHHRKKEVNMPERTDCNELKQM